MLGITQRTSFQGRCTMQRPAAAFQVRGVRPCARRVQLRATAETQSKTETKKKKKAEEEEFSDGPEVAPTTAQVQAFLSTLCGDTEIAQVELKLGTFALKVRRSIEAAEEPAAAPAAPSGPMAVAVAAPATATTVVVTSEVGGLVEDSVDETLVYVTSPKVGIFRRGKYAAGKRIGKGEMIKSGDSLKKGQAVAYVEQLGTFVEIKTPQAGEVVKFRLEEGDPVEYGQVVMDLAPFFGGHIIGDSKHA